MFKKTVSLITLLGFIFFMSSITGIDAKVDTSAPIIKQSQPNNYQTDCNVDIIISMTFNENVYKGNTFSKIKLTSKNGAAVKIQVTISQNVLNISHSNKLSNYTDYFVTIPNNAIKDKTGNGFKKTIKIIFRTEADGKTNSSGKVNLVFGWWGEKARNDATMAAIKIWNSTHPEIQVGGAYQGWDGYSAKLAASFAGDNAPDIFQISFSDFEQFSKENLLLDLTSFKSTDFAGIDKSLWTNLIYNGKTRAVASGIQGCVGIYNKTKAEKYKLAPLTDGDTMDTLLAKCKKATLDTNGDGKTDLYGIFDPMDTDPESYNNFVRPFGLSVWTSNLKGCLFSNSKVIKQIKKYEQFRKSKVILPDDVSIMNGQTYMGIGAIEYDKSSLSILPEVMAGTRDEIGLAMEPKPFAGGKDLRATTSIPIAINSMCKYPDAAVKFLSWFLTDPRSAIALKMVRSVPPSKTQRDALLSISNPIEKNIVEIASKLQALGNVAFEKVPNNYGQFLEIFQQEKNRYLLNAITLDQFMTNLQEAGNPIFAAS